MAIHRYWRIVGVCTSGNAALELSEARIYEAGVVADATATLTASIAPASGALVDLRDDLTSGVVSWPFSSYGAPGFSLLWDFGSGLGVTTPSLKLGSGTSASTFVADLVFQSSDDAVNWATLVSSISIIYPGANSLTTMELVTYATQVISDAPVRYFRLNDSAGTTAVDSMGAGNGTYSGGYTLGQAAFVTGGNSVNFNAAASPGGKVDCNFNVNYTAEFSVELFANIAATGQDGTPSIISKSSFYANAPTDFPFFMRWDPVALKIVCLLSSGNDFTTDATITSAVLATGTDYHVAFIYRANGLCEIYINGTLSASATIAFAVSSGTSNWTIATPTENGGGAGAGSFSGRIAEVAIYNYALSNSKVSAHSGAMAFDVIATQHPSPSRTRQIVNLPDRLLPSAAVPDSTATGHLRELPFFDVYNGGLGIIYGTVKEKGTPDAPLHRKVWLMDQASGMVVRETWSDAGTGAYEFRGVRQGVPYTVLAFDYTGTYRAVIADNQTPELIV